MTLLYLRDRAAKLAARIKTMATEYKDRKEAGKSGPELWPDNTAEEWREVNAEFDDVSRKIEDETENKS